MNSTKDCVVTTDLLVNIAWTFILWSVIVSPFTYLIAIIRRNIWRSIPPLFTLVSKFDP